MRISAQVHLPLIELPERESRALHITLNAISMDFSIVLKRESPYTVKFEELVRALTLQGEHPVLTFFDSNGTTSVVIQTSSDPPITETVKWTAREVGSKQGKYIDNFPPSVGVEIIDVLREVHEFWKAKFTPTSVLWVGDLPVDEQAPLILKNAYGEFDELSILYQVPSEKNPDYSLLHAQISINGKSLLEHAFHSSPAGFNSADPLELTGLRRSADNSGVHLLEICTCGSPGCASTFVETVVLEDEVHWKRYYSATSYSRLIKTENTDSIIAIWANAATDWLWVESTFQLSKEESEEYNSNVRTYPPHERLYPFACREFRFRRADYKRAISQFEETIRFFADKYGRENVHGPGGVFLYGRPALKHAS